MGQVEQLTFATSRCLNYSGGDIAKVKCIVSAGNPLMPLAPNIDYEFTLEINYSNTSSPQYSLIGTHDGYPAYEVYLNNKRIYQHDPGGTKTPWSLWGDSDESMNESGAIN